MGPAFVEKTTCPWCGAEHELASALGHEGHPERGNLTLCIACGRWCVFIGHNKLRKPNYRQREIIRTDLALRRVERAWHIATGKPVPPP